MINERFILILILFCFWELSFAQDLDMGFENYQNFTVENGLPSNQINCFAKDSEGFMWIGTSDGLARFDGSETVVYQNIEGDSTSISGNHIRCILMEGDSIMWVGTAVNGLNKFSFKTQKFKHYLPKTDDPRSIPSEEVIALEHDAFGKLWIGFHRSGICKYNQEEDNFSYIELPEFEENQYSRSNRIVIKFLFDKDDKQVVWIFTLHVLVRYDQKDETFKFYNYNSEEDKKNVRTNSIGDGIRISNGKFYIACSRKGVLVFDPKTEKWTNFNDKEYNPLNYHENHYNVIEQIDSTTFWLGSQFKGLAILDIKKGYIYPLDSCGGEEPVPSDRLCGLHITCIDMNAKEGHWIGTDKGLRLYNRVGNQFSTFIHQPETKNLKNRANVVAIFQSDSKGIYYGGYAGDGLYYFDFKSKSKSLIKPPKKYQPGVVHEMFYTRCMLPYNDSTLIVLSDNALFKLHLATKRLEEIDFGLKYTKDYFYLHRIFRHTDRTYYISTRHSGIFHLSSEFKLIEHLEHQSDEENSLVSSNYIYEITEDPFGKVWIGTEDGFSVFDPETSSFSNSNYLERIDSIPNLKIILSIKRAPDSSLWFIDARANGVYLNYPYQKPYHFIPIVSARDGSTERLKNILFTSDHKTIMTTENGLSIKNSDGEIIRYNQKQGLPELRTLGPLVELWDGRIAIGSGKNLILFHPDSLKEVPRDLPIYLSSISVFNEPYEVNLKDVTENGLVLTYLQNFFAINIGTINFDNPEEYTLSYRLKGLNDNWFTDKEKKAVFTHIPGGKYHFEARFLDKDNQVLQQEISFPIEIIPPFWETWWFKAVALVIFLSIGLAFYFIRTRSIRREAQLKTEFNKQIANMELSALRSQMNPHFLFNSLNSIRNKIIKNEAEEADKYLVKFSRLVRQILDNSRKDLISIKDELETLGLYIELESSRFEHRFEYEINLADGINVEQLKIPPMIVQPYVENAIWHGLMQKEDSGKVSISISILEQSLHIVIEDDGVGREKAKELKSKRAEKRQSMGMEITGNRLEIIEKLYQLKCSAEISDLKNENNKAIGTRVTLTLPLIYES